MKKQHESASKFDPAMSDLIKDDRIWGFLEDVKKAGSEYNKDVSDRGLQLALSAGENSYRQKIDKAASIVKNNVRAFADEQMDLLKKKINNE